MAPLEQSYLHPMFRSNGASKPWYRLLIPGRLQFILELGVFFVLTEGLLRRIVPGMAIAVLGFKFAYFPLAYLILHTHLSQHQQVNWIPRSAKLFLGWGVFLTVAQIWNYQVVGFVGMLVNLAFVPVAYFAARLYPTRDDLRGLFWRLATFAGLLGLLGLYQSTLPPSHWLNMLIRMDEKGLALGDTVRVSATFQFCNVFGQFGSLAMIAAVGGCLCAAGRFESFWAMLCGSVCYIGVLHSGSRMGGVGAILVLAVCLIGAGRMRKRLVSVLLTISVLGATAWITARLLNWPVLDLESVYRSYDTEDLVARRDLYASSVFAEALQFSNAIGTGWGPYTMGAAHYAQRLGLHAVDMSGTTVEGGYPTMMAQLGLIGLVLFVYLHWSIISICWIGGTDMRWLGLGTAVWSILGNVPLPLQEIPALAIPWWMLVGIAMSRPRSPI